MTADDIHGDETLAADPSFRREIAKLRWLDLILGTADRFCGGNYLVDRTMDGKVKVTGVDNDLTFGSENSHFNLDCMHDVEPPKVIDSEMAKAILELKPEVLKSALPARFSQREVDATLSRLSKAKAYIEELSQRGDVIDPKRWSEFDDPAEI